MRFKRRGGNPMAYEEVEETGGHETPMTVNVNKQGGLLQSLGVSSFFYQKKGKFRRSL